MDLVPFENLLKESIGLDVASIGVSAIERAVLERVSACRLKDPAVYWPLLQASHDELQALIEAVVVPETWFFRDRHAFAALTRIVQEEWLPAHPAGVLRVLSMPSSTGEEAYSVAMSLLDAGVQADRFSVDAVDISARVVAYARSARYGRNSFRGEDLAFRDRHFEETPGGYRLNDRVRQRVTFRQGNLFGSGSPGSAIYDMIFCRNLLIYFDHETQDRAIVVLSRQLAPDGVLFVAPAETGILLGHGFTSAKVPLAFAFRKMVEAARGPTRDARAGPKRPVVGRPAAVAALVARSAPSLEVARPSGVVATPVSALRSEMDIELDAARLLANQGRLAEATERCQQHLQRRGPSAEVFHLLGLVRDASGDASGAATFYRKALYLDPHHYEVLIHLALVMDTLGRTSDAALLRQRAGRRRPSTETEEQHAR
jgi:chemotaxis protein methyltransferase WspC